MLSRGIYCSAVIMALSAVAIADDPALEKNPKKQRVSPKVLREVLALPEYQVQSAAATSIPTLEDVKQLAERLKKSGDLDGADLLTRFVQHQQKQATAAAKERLTVNVKIVEVNTADLEKANSLHPTPTPADLAADVDELLKSQKAEVQNSITIQSTENESTSCHIGNGTIAVPHPGADGKIAIDHRDFGTTIELLPKLTAKDRVSLQLMVETQDKDTANTVTLQGTDIPGVTKRRLQSTCELNLGETFVLGGVHSAILSGANAPKGRSVLLLAKVTKDK